MEICNTSQQAAKLKEQVIQLRSKNSRKVIEICDVLEKYAYSADDMELLGFVFFYRGEAYYILNRIDDMFDNIANSVTFFSMTEQWDLLARSYNMMAIVSINKGNAPMAVDYYLASLKCAKEHGINWMECSIHINVGYLYMQNGLYSEALNHFNEAHAIYDNSEDKEAQIGRLIMIYTNLASCHMLRKDMSCAGEYIRKIDTECRPYFTDMDFVYVGCMEARYYNICKDEKKRDEIISNIMKRLDSQLPILDLFDDLYSLCELALENGDYDICINIAMKLEPVIENTHMINLERQLLILKLRYYEIMHDDAKYAEATGRFYMLAMVVEEENKNMISNMLHIRAALEQANESKKAIEAENAMLTEKSETDQLTGLANRYRLTDYSQKLMDDCLHSDMPFAVEILDIDYFKEYNDNYGHQAGDECIKKVSKLIKNMQNENIFCARYGGDEFIIIYSGLDEHEVRCEAARLKNDIMALDIKHEFSKAFPMVTISQGICQSVPQEGNKSWDFLHVADEYLYKVKKQTRNAICFGDIKGHSDIV